MTGQRGGPHATAFVDTLQRVRYAFEFTRTNLSLRGERTLPPYGRRKASDTRTGFF
jgi:hypothetical protein